MCKTSSSTTPGSQSELLSYHSTEPNRHPASLVWHTSPFLNRYWHNCKLMKERSFLLKIKILITGTSGNSGVCLWYIFAFRMIHIPWSWNSSSCLMDVFPHNNDSPWMYEVDDTLSPLNPLRNLVYTFGLLNKT